MTIILNNIDIDEEYINILNMAITSFEDKKFSFYLNIIISRIGFKDDWNKRCWTFQESVLNKNIFIFSGKLLSLKELSYILHDNVYNGCKDSLWEICYYIKKTKNIYKIGEILKLTKDRKSKLPQDKIYSILGLIDNRISNNIEINYKLDIKKIYVNLFKEAIKINDFSWLNIIFELDFSCVNILYNKINIANNNLCFKSYIMKNNIKKIIKTIYNRREFYDKILEFGKKIMTENNFNFTNGNFCDYIYTDENNKLSIMSRNLGIDISFYPSSDFYILTLYDEFIGMIIINNINYINEAVFLLNRYYTLTKKLWNCIIIRDKKIIGNGFININEKYLEQKDIKVELNLDYLINNDIL